MEYRGYIFYYISNIPYFKNYMWLVSKGTTVGPTESCLQCSCLCITCLIILNWALCGTNKTVVEMILNDFGH